MLRGNVCIALSFMYSRFDNNNNNLNLNQISPLSDLCQEGKGQHSPAFKVFMTLLPINDRDSQRHEFQVPGEAFSQSRPRCQDHLNMAILADNSQPAPGHSQNLPLITPSHQSLLLSFIKDLGKIQNNHHFKIKSACGEHV